MRGPPAPVNPNITDFPPAAAENGHITPQQIQYPTLQGQVAPTAEVKMTLFHWQVQQEAQRIESISPEMVNMQDSDGDTYVLIKKVIISVELPGRTNG